MVRLRGASICPISGFSGLNTTETSEEPVAPVVDTIMLMECGVQSVRIIVAGRET